MECHQHPPPRAPQDHIQPRPEGCCGRRWHPSLPRLCPLPRAVLGDTSPSLSPSPSRSPPLGLGRDGCHIPETPQLWTGPNVHTKDMIPQRPQPSCAYLGLIWAQQRQALEHRSRSWSPASPGTRSGARAQTPAPKHLPPCPSASPGGHEDVPAGGSHQHGLQTPQPCPGSSRIPSRGLLQAAAGPAAGRNRSLASRLGLSPASSYHRFSCLTSSSPP